MEWIVEWNGSIYVPLLNNKLAMLNHIHVRSIGGIQSPN